MVAPETTTAVPPLNPKQIEKLPPGEYRDGNAPGLRLRVTAHGTRVFRWAVTRAGKQEWITIGRWSMKSRAGHVTLAEAHVRLEGLKKAHAEGRLDSALAEHRPPKARPSAGAGPLTVRQAAADFLDHLDRRRRRPEQARAAFTRDIIGTEEDPNPFGDKLMSEVRKSDIIGVLEPIVRRGSPVAAEHTLRLVRQFFLWAVDRADDLPMPGIPKLETIEAKKADTSKRVLSPEEIRGFWDALATGGITPTIRNGLRLLLLIGCRSGELRQATWDEFDLDAGRWVVPPEHQKSHLSGRDKKPAEPWPIPLPPTAVAILRELRALSDSIGSKYVLASFALQEVEPGVKRTGEPITDKALTHGMAGLFAGKAPALTFEGERPSPHDLRRTLRYYARQKLGVPFDTAEKLLGHSLGILAATYDPGGKVIPGDPGDLYEERREALLAWDGYVQRLLTGKTAMVVPLHRKARRS